MKKSLKLIRKVVFALLEQYEEYKKRGNDLLSLFGTVSFHFELYLGVSGFRDWRVK
jgi:hypothetical protein